MASILRQLKHAIHEHPIWYPALQRLRGQEWGDFCGAGSDLCIEGCQSSSNSFVYNVFRHLGPDLSIAHHTHSVSNLKRALRYDVPTLIVFRDPADAIPSLASRFKPTVEEGAFRYRRFHEFVLDHVDQFILAGFEETTSQIGDTIRRVEARTPLTFAPHDPETVADEAIRHIKEWTAAEGNEGQISLPQQERERQKEKRRAELRGLPEFDEIRRVYSDMKRAFERQKSTDS